MGTLMNVATNPEERQGDFPSEGLSPLTAADLSQDDRIGVSLDCVLHPTHEFPQDYRWYAIRATYGCEQEAEDLVTDLGLLAYVPKRKTLKLVRGKKKKVTESLLPNLLFVFTDESTARKLVSMPLRSDHCRRDKMPVTLHFMYDHTSLNPNGQNCVVTIPRQEMLNLIRFTLAGSECVRAVSQSEFRIKADQQVMITEGEFKGVVGRVARVGRQTCVVVDLQPICFFASAYIPKAFLQVVDGAEPVSETSQV
ncbi:MAG: UpxY family transcription antiterminator [Paraprevotella sp.]|nr:UpxY family transcription antiterminator [Paraprevotella sp.]